MAASACECGRVIEQPRTGRPRTKCLICSPKRLASVPTDGVQAAPGPAPALVEATRAQLASADRDGTPEGLIVLMLAGQIAAGGGTAAGLAALVREFHASKVRALAGAEQDGDVIEGIFRSESG